MWCSANQQILLPRYCFLIFLFFWLTQHFDIDILNKSFSLSTEPLGGNLACRDSTPMWKEPESTIHIGKRPGENTLKKELWTRFEEASTHGLRFNASGLQNTTQKGFLDLLDEASCDEES